MISKKERDELIVLVCATAEVIGCEIKSSVATLIVDDLINYSIDDVKQALALCRREVKGRLSLKDILDRLENDNLPSPDEMFVQIADWCDDESKTFVLPDIAFRACEETNGGVYHSLMAGDRTGARMAFKNAYERLSKTYIGKPKYEIRIGTDGEQKRRALIEAVEQGKISDNMALQVLPDLRLGNSVALPNTVKQLSVAKTM